MDKNPNTTLVKGLQSFAHGAFYGNKGDMIEMPTAIANELAAAGLVATVTEKAPAKTTPKPTPEADAPVPPAAKENDAPAPTAQPEDLGLKAAPVAHNKMAKPVVNKAK